MTDDRRRLLRGMLGLAAWATLPSLARAGLATPRQPYGPFYPDEPPLDDDNDLVHVKGLASPARGEVTDLGGRLLDRGGRPMRDVRIEIWQCDANGRYHHPRDRGDRAPDPGFQGFGHTRSDHEGRYRFLTIRPVRYPGRTPHIHVAVTPPGGEPFVTQLYVAGEPGNDADFLYRRIPVEQRGLVTTALVPGGRSGAVLRADWDIVLDPGAT